MRDDAARVPILVWSTFKPSVSAVGGNLRTAQIFELSHEAGFLPQSIECGRVGIVSRLLAGWQARMGLRRAGVRLSWRSWSLAGFYAVNVTRALRAHTGARILLWESTTSAVPAWVARQHGFAVVALAQSIEAFDTEKECMTSLEREAERLSLADRVFCISEAERWLLTNIGISSDWLPYFPPKARCVARAEVAAIRAGGVRRDSPWLVIGTTHYPPTREGMLRLLSWLDPAIRANLSVVVAGFGTEDLSKYFPNSRMIFLGPVSEETLTRLLIDARGLIVHQDRGCGSITRIPDALLAGLPVVASRFAARDTGAHPGIHIYDTQEEMIALVQSSGFAAFSPPRPPAAAVARFTRVLEDLAAARGEGPPKEA